MTREEAIKFFERMKSEEEKTIESLKNGLGVTSSAHQRFVEYFSMAISALREQPRWISVEERLPEQEKRVLACYINPLRKDRPPRMMVGEGTSTTLVKGKVYLWCGGWRSITHWMELPEPPKEG